MREKDAASSIAKYIAAANYDDIPEEVVGVTKKSILDTLGVMIGATGIGEGCKEIVRLVKEMGGREESSILVFGGKVPCVMAAFANGSMGHTIDYDDIVDDALAHPTAATLPAAIAVAERVGRVNGKEFITAVTLGIDLLVRMALAVTQSTQGYKNDWHLTPTLGAFSSAAAAGKLLRLDESKIVDALGIALHQAAGSMEMAYSPGSIIRGLYDAFPAKAGVLSALMAQYGITGTKACLEGKAGLYNLYFRGGYDSASLTKNLGRRFEGVNMSFKMWPSCRLTHAYIDATIGIVSENDIRPGDIAEIIVSVGEFTRTVCEPLELRRKPPTSIDAKFSVPFTVAVAAKERKVSLRDFSLEGLRDPATLELAQRVTVRLDPQLTTSHNLPPAIVNIKTKNGAGYSKRVDFPRGHPRNPITMDDLTAKFRDCVSNSAKPLSKDSIEKVIDLVAKLEEVTDVTQIIRLIA